MKILIGLLMGLCLFGMTVHADTVLLKNGSAVEGKVIEQTPEAVRLDVGGTTLTYYQDEIASVDTGSGPLPLASQAPAAVAPVDVPVEAPVAAAVVEPVPAPQAPVAEAAPAAPEVPVVEAAPVLPVADEFSGMSKEALINKFVEIYGVKENMQANFDQMTSTLKPEQAEEFRNAIRVDAIVQELLPIYDKHFSEADLKAYIRFYGSDEGKKLIRTLPLVMKDSVDVSMKYLEAHLPESLKQDQPAGNN